MTAGYSSLFPWVPKRVWVPPIHRVDSPFTHVTEEDRKFVLDNINKRLKLMEPLTNDDVIAER